MGEELRWAGPDGSSSRAEKSERNQAALSQASQLSAPQLTQEAEHPQREGALRQDRPTRV